MHASPNKSPILMCFVKNEEEEEEEQNLNRRKNSVTRRTKREKKEGEKNLPAGHKINVAATMEMILNQNFKQDPQY